MAPNANGLHIENATAFEPVCELWDEYWASLGLPADFQNFASELQSLPGKYSEPQGCIALASIRGRPAGTIALRPLSETGCEVKRLYVRPEFRGCGVGRALMLWIMQRARAIGYAKMNADTLPSMSDALAMYRNLGFRRIDQPYSTTPTPGAIYLELTLI